MFIKERSKSLLLVGWMMFSGYEQFPIISIKSLNMIEKAIKKLKKVLADNLAGNNVEIFTYKL